jgi:hypothetical protein
VAVKRVLLRARSTSSAYFGYNTSLIAMPIRADPQTSDTACCCETARLIAALSEC